LKTELNYLKLISELITFETLTSNDLEGNFMASLGAEEKAAQKRIKDKVNLYCLEILITILFLYF